MSRTRITFHAFDVSFLSHSSISSFRLSRPFPPPLPPTTLLLLYTTLWSGVQPASQLTPHHLSCFSFPLPLFSLSLCQGSQDAMGAQEGLVPPPYSSFPPPPPPPPQNGLPLDFGGSGIYPTGGQGQVEAPAGITNPPTAPSTLNTQVSVITRAPSIW